MPKQGATLIYKQLVANAGEQGQILDEKASHANIHQLEPQAGDILIFKADEAGSWFTWAVEKLQGSETHVAIFLGWEPYMGEQGQVLHRPIIAEALSAGVAIGPLGNFKGAKAYRYRGSSTKDTARMIGRRQVTAQYVQEQTARYALLHGRNSKTENLGTEFGESLYMGNDTQYSALQAFLSLIRFAKLEPNAEDSSVFDGEYESKFRNREKEAWGAHEHNRYRWPWQGVFCSKIASQACTLAAGDFHENATPRLIQLLVGYCLLDTEVWQSEQLLQSLKEMLQLTIKPFFLHKDNISFPFRYLDTINFFEQLLDEQGNFSEWNFAVATKSIEYLAYEFGYIQAPDQKSTGDPAYQYIQEQQEQDGRFTFPLPKKLQTERLINMLETITIQLTQARGDKSALFPGCREFSIDNIRAVLDPKQTPSSAGFLELLMEYLQISITMRRIFPFSTRDVCVSQLSSELSKDSRFVCIGEWEASEFDVKGKPINYYHHEGMQCFRRGWQFATTWLTPNGEIEEIAPLTCDTELTPGDQAAIGIGYQLRGDVEPRLDDYDPEDYEPAATAKPAKKSWLRKVFG